MPLLQHLQRQVTRASTGRLSTQSYRTANQIWRPQQRAQFHRLFAQKTVYTANNTATWRQLLSRFRNPSSRRWNSSRPTPDPTPQLGSPSPQLSFFQRFKQLGKEYGWVVTGIYFGLSALDLPFCFLAVRALGPDRVAAWEHAIVGTVKDAFKAVMPEMGAKADEVVDQVETAVGSPAAREGNVWGVPEAEARNKEEACTSNTHTARHISHADIPKLSGHNLSSPTPFTNPSSSSEYHWPLPSHPRLSRFCDLGDGRSERRS
jgi:hypothetical protein